MRKSRRYYRRRNKTPLLAILIIVFALAVVTGSKIVSGNALDHSQTDSSYGAQTADHSSEAADTARLIRQADVAAGMKIDEYKGVAVYSNGADYMSSHGLSYSKDGYYYGYKWQCVEFVKRFYYEIYHHEMPDGAGNAKYFFNPMLAQGKLNEQRGLVQYVNGGNEKPREGDLLVFNEGSYGHVAIICGVADEWIEVIQQNSEVPREKYSLVYKDGTYTISGDREPAGWLRVSSR
ncbi:CHAP domain-containing protein [Dehalobacter restrictus]|uniref:CHAP domain-containing protein n=1 Tax=Dehalobacter restrictus TaxID=55583 RepID=UPI00046D45C1|nr:CHAP domain-containing protein [Dehalobacter restrictus]